MFSSRFRWGAEQNRLSRILDRKKSLGIPILDLTESNPTRAGFRYDELRILASVGGPEALTYRPEPRGLLDARRAVVEYYADHGRRVDVDTLFLTASTSEAYAYLFKLLCDPGDEILVPVPSYPLFEFLAGLECLQVGSYPMVYDDYAGWRIDLERLAEVIGPRTRALVVVNPNNPTGCYLKTQELSRIKAVCRRHGLALISDEVFLDYRSPHPEEARTGSLAGGTEVLTFVLSGLSKIAGLPQIKLAWIQVGGPESEVARACGHLELLADTYLSVSTPAMAAAEVLLTGRTGFQTQVLERIAGNADLLEAELDGRQGFRVLRREGGWYGIVQGPDSVSDDEQACRLLSEADVYVHPGYFYDIEDRNCWVVGLLTPREAFESGVRRWIRQAALWEEASP